MTAATTIIDAVRIAAAAADRVKANDIVAFDVTDLLAFTEVMMIASASNERQVLRTSAIRWSPRRSPRRWRRTCT